MPIGIVVLFIIGPTVIVTIVVTIVAFAFTFTTTATVLIPFSFLFFGVYCCNSLIDIVLPAVNSLALICL